ncbi:MAG: CaiB/BaiF CoA-transferase family protein, partial [Azospirillaceae bacterium]
AIGNAAAREVNVEPAASVVVVVEDYRPGVLDGLGLGYQALSARHAGLVYCSLSLCGQTGPYRDKPGHDPVALAIAGVLSRSGEDPAAPGFPGIPVADVVTGSHAAFGILAALIARARDGRGQQVDIAMSDCALSLLVNVLSRHPDLATIPPRGERRADTGLWRTADGKFICTTDMEPRYWQAFCAAVGRPDFAGLQHDVAARPMIRAELAAIFETRRQADWLAVLEAAGTQFAPVNDVAEALSDRHVAARGMAPAVPDGSGGTVRQIGPPVRLTRTPAAIRRLAVIPGHDRDEVLAAIGHGETTVDELARRGAFGPAPASDDQDQTRSKGRRA